MEITSPAFKDHETIPVKYTCQGENISPPLHFKNIPQNTKTLSLIMDDPDAPGGIFDHSLHFKNIPQNTKTLSLIMDDPDAPGGIFDHWLVWNMDPESKELLEGEARLTTGRIVI